MPKGKEAIQRKPEIPARKGYRPLSYQVWAPEKAGEELEAEYLRTIEVKSPPAFRRKGGEEAKDSFRAHHLAELGTGLIWTVSGASLDMVFENIKYGTIVLIVYQGMRELDGGRKMKDFQVYQKE